MIPLYTLNFILGFIIFAPLTESYNVFVLDKKGHIAELQNPIHIDAENTPKEMRARLQKQLRDFLDKSKKHHHGKDVREKTRSEHDSTSLGNKYSPVVFSNGRYILDFDSFDIRGVKVVTKKPNKQPMFDPTESFRDYYDFVKDRLQSNDIAKYYAKNVRSKNDSSFRKRNELLLGSKIPRTRDSESIEDLDIKKKERSFKRFKVVSNDRKRKRHKSSSKKVAKKKRKKVAKNKRYSSEEFSASNKDSFESTSVEKPKKKKVSEESNESDDGYFYLQGNELVKLKSKNAVSDNEEDFRRRLPYFMPKRFHWSPKEMKNLGYFWFNGPKGKYSEAVPL